MTGYVLSVESARTSLKYRNRITQSTPEAVDKLSGCSHYRVTSSCRLSAVFVHVVVVAFVIAGGDVVHPFLVVEIPAHGFFYAFLEL